MKQYIHTHFFRPHQWFVAIGLIFGTMFVFINPPFKVPDEFGHMARAYGISEGHFIAAKQGNKSGSDIPVSLAIVGNKTNEHFSPADIPQLATIPLDAGNKTFAEHPNMVLYSPLVYAPQAIGFAAARTFNAPAIDALYIARFCNLLAYIALLYVAIRLLPFAKWVGVIVGLLPMHILLAGSMSADPVSVGVGAVFIAAVLRLRTYTQKIPAKQLLLLLGLVAALSLTKLPFPLLAALLALVPPKVLGGTRKMWLLALGGIAVWAAIVGLGWLWLAKSALVDYGPAGVDPAAQLQFMLGHPLGFIKALAFTLFGPAGDGFAGMYVLSIGFVAAQLPLWLTYLYSIFLAFAVLPLRVESTATLKTTWQRWLVAGLIAALVFIIAVLLYLSWTPVGKGVIDGMQARYLTPLLFLLIPLLAVRSTKTKVQEGSLPVGWYRWGSIFFLAAGIFMTAYYFYFS